MLGLNFAHRGRLSWTHNEPTIHFNLNGDPVKAVVEPQDNVVECFATCFELYGARESCGQACAAAAPS